MELNRQSTLLQPSRDNEFPLTWINEPTAPPSREEVLSWLTALADEELRDKAKYPDKAAYLTAIRNSIPSNIGAMNVRLAWGAPDGTDLPVAVHPAHIHPRITAQKGCFTIHGKLERPLSELVPPRILRQYRIHAASFESIRSDLRLAGITYSTMFPDLDGLAVDLRSWF